MKDLTGTERKIALKNQLRIEVSMGKIYFTPIKPFVARTKDGDYFFETKEEAQNFALSRGGFFDTVKHIIDIKKKRLKGGDA